MKLEEMYRIPWTKTDNPNAWVEVTTHCQLTCPGCYREFDVGQEAEPEDKLHELKADIDHLVEFRNIQTLSIAGGEPLLFPLLDDLLEYTRAKGIVPRLFTNGVLLTEPRLRRLIAAGLGEVIVHASLWQQRPSIDTLPELLRLKTRFCDMFRRHHQVRLGFIEPAMRSNLDSFEGLFQFYRDNADVVSNVVFTTFKDEYGGPDGEYVPLPEVSERIVASYGTQPCAYIPKIYHQERAAWLLNAPLIEDGEVVGSMDGSEYGAMQEMFHAVTGKYLFTPDLAEDGAKMQHYQVLSIVDSPQMLQDGRVDMCDSCPDAMLYEGELVPKCILDKIKGGLEVAVVR